MNIQKEREAFEEAYQPDPQKSPFPYFLFNEEKNLYEAHSFDEREVSLINAAWWGWQERGKKLEGCVVVPVEPTEEMVHAFEKGMLESEHFFGEFEAFNDGYKAMVEAARGGNE